MPDPKQPATASGADLARQALAAYKATAPRGPVRAVPKRRATNSRDRGPGRDPVGLGGILGTLNTEQGWAVSLSAGSITDQWADLAPELVGHVEPVHYDPETGCLDLRPGSPAYATQLRMFGRPLRDRINTKLGWPTVRSIRVLRVGTVSSTLASSAGPAKPAGAAAQVPPADPGPVRTRDTASDGYKATRAAIRRPEPHPLDHLITAAVDRQNRTIAREPQEAFAPAAEARAEETASTQELRPSEAARRAALAYKHSGNHTTDRTVRRAFDAA